MLSIFSAILTGSLLVSLMTDSQTLGQQPSNFSRFTTNQQEASLPQLLPQSGRSDGLKDSLAGNEFFHRGSGRRELMGRYM
jgi:hypothetical protein